MWGSGNADQEPVSREEYNRLEARLRQAEATLRTTEAITKMLQQQLQGFGMMGMGGGMGGMGGCGMSQLGAMRAVDHSRSPRPAGGRQPAGTGVATQSATEFALANGIDEKCLEALLSQPDEVQNYVISQGPVEGRNPSAMVMSRITKYGGGGGGSLGLGLGPGNAQPTAAPAFSQARPAKAAWAGEDVSAQVEEFIVENSLDDKCAEALRTQAPDVQATVLNQGPAAGRNPSAMVIGRIAKVARGGM